MAQSIGVIMGANIGTTITAQIVAFKVTKAALLMIGVGFAMIFASRRERTRQYGAMLMGLGLVFFGMSVMGEAMKPLRTYQPFLDAMVSMENPLIGILIAVWMIAGVVPYLISLGLELLNPKAFLPAACAICAVISLATGSSWTTASTVGVALMGVGNGLALPSAMAAGAIVSGAYFGDKMSPLSDSTNLAPAVTGVAITTSNTIESPTTTSLRIPTSRRVSERDSHLGIGQRLRLRTKCLGDVRWSQL